MDDQAVDLRELCAEFLEGYFVAGDSWAGLTQRMLSRLPTASIDETTDALHCLWRLTRHFTRESCWSQITWELLELHKQGKLSGDIPIRQEISDWFVRPSTQCDALRKEEDEPERLRPAKPLPVSATIDEYVRSYCPQGDPVALALPKVESYDDEGGVERYWYLYRDIEGEWSSDHFHALGALAQAFALRVGDSDEFWAVFGPFQDALAYDNATGFEGEIEAGRQALVRERIRTGHADLYDHWLLLRDEEDEYDRGRIVEKMISYIRDASAAECEEFFHGLDFAPDGPFGELVEADWPNADKLWHTITQKKDLSLWLHARAGFYY